MTPSGIEPATFRFVAQHLNHCATAVPIFTSSITLKHYFGNASLMCNSPGTFRVFSVYHSTTKMCTKRTVNTDDIITDDLLLCIRNYGQLSFLVPDHEFNQKPSLIFHILYKICIYLLCCGLLFT